jgi:poly(hydroxyalkanoate) depolymerase family esterase
MIRRPIAALAALVLALAAACLPNPTTASTGTAAADTCTAVSSADLAAHGWANEPGGQHYSCVHADPGLGLQRTYWVYVPSGAARDDSMPLFVVLHGCTEQAPDIAYISRFDWEAEQKHFVVAYPEQAAFQSTGTTTFDGNGSRCWNWFLPQGQARGAGEPALIAGITQNVVASHHTDRARTFVIGISAGGATADIMAATYPDLYAAAGVLAGCEYRGLPCLASAAVQPPQLSGQLAYAASGAHARVVPFLVENGDADPVVPVGNAFEVVQQMQVTDDYAAHHGVLTNPVPAGPCGATTVTPSPAGDTTQSPPIVYNPYDVLYYSADGSACPAATAPAKGLLGELIVVHGELHAWPGGPQPTTTEIYTNPGGPNVTDIAYHFFMAHPCHVHAGSCAPAA